MGSLIFIRVRALCCSKALGIGPFVIVFASLKPSSPKDRASLLDISFLKNEEGERGDIKTAT